MERSRTKTITAHPTMYKGVRFRSRLEARWAAFFDLAGWEWHYEPLDLVGWVPDFFVKFNCSHSECHGNHKLLIEVKPYFTIEEFDGHPCMNYPFGFMGEEKVIPADASAAFGINPDVTYWEMSHGAGGGYSDVNMWIHNSAELWVQAGNVVQWIKKKPTVYGKVILSERAAQSVAQLSRIKS